MSDREVPEGCELVVMRSCHVAEMRAMVDLIAEGDQVMGPAMPAFWAQALVGLNPPPLHPPCWVTWGTGETTHLWILTKRYKGAFGVSEWAGLGLTDLVHDVAKLKRCPRPEWADAVGEDDWRYPLVNDPRLDR